MAELDATLDRIADSLSYEALPVVVDIFPTGQERLAPTLQLAIISVSMTRSFLLWLDWNHDDTTGWAHEHGQPPPAAPWHAATAVRPSSTNPSTCASPHTPPAKLPVNT